MQWRVVDDEISPDGLVLARITNGRDTLNVLAAIVLNRHAVVLSGFHVQGSGRNTMGPGMLRAVAHAVMELLDVDELRIEGAARTSGASPGRRPAPLVFRRPGAAGPAA